MHDETAWLPATEMARRVRAGEVTSRALVEAHLQRVERLDGRLGAVATLDAEGARAAADAADAHVAAGRPLGALHGVPMTVKDAFMVQGVRSTSGMPDLADDVPDRDALAVARLRAAGVVVLGKSNVPPGVTGQETANPLFGRTSNPWDLARTCGGSSGGAAAAVAAGLTPLELGSDIGGSVRQPAHCCGVYGHVASHGLVPYDGHRPSVGPDQPGKDVDLLYVGGLGRHVEDLEALLRAVAGPHPLTGRGWRLELPPPRVRTLDGARVAAWLDDDACPLDPPVREVVEGAADALARAGAAVDRTARPGFGLDEAREVAFALWVAASSERTDDEQLERLRAVAARGGGSLEVQRARAETLAHRDWLRTDTHRRRLQTGWLDLLDEHDVLLLPVSPFAALPHDPEPEQVASVDHRLARTVELTDGRVRPYLDQLVWPTVTGMAGLPCTVVPVGLTGDGLPVGVQVVGRPGDDLTTLRVGRLLGEVTGAPRRPPGWD